MTHAGKGLGADMLSDALRRIAVASQSIGIGAVLVQAKDDAAKHFYIECARIHRVSDGQPNLVSSYRNRGRCIQLNFGRDAMGEAKRSSKQAGAIGLAARGQLLG